MWVLSFYGDIDANKHHTIYISKMYGNLFYTIANIHEIKKVS